MDIINEILLTLDEITAKEFRHHLIRQRPDADRKDLKLFETLLSDAPHPERGTAPYHANRKRLAKSLTEFIILKQMSDDASGVGDILGALSAALYMFDFKRDEAGWHFLLRARDAAVRSGRPDALLQVYRIMADHLHKQEEITPDRLDGMAAQAARASEAEDRMRFGLAHIRQQLTDAKRKGLPLEPLLAQELAATNQEDVSPRQMLRLIEMLRSAALSGRDLRQFRDFVAGRYGALQAAMEPIPVFAKEQISLAYIHAHALFRTRGYGLMDGPLEVMRAKMELRPALKKAFSAKYYSLKGSALSLTGRNAEAISLHEELLNARANGLSIEDRLNMELNLVFFRFNQSEYGKAARLLSLMHHSRAWYEKRMGAEWVMRKELIRAIVHFEQDDPDQALRTAEQLRKNYAHVLGTTAYIKAGAFIDLVIRFLRNPSDLNKDKVVSVSESVLSDIPAGQEDTNQLAFYCWLLAKALNQPYYPILLKEAAETAKSA